MSEIINNSAIRKAKLKALILKLHDGSSKEQVREELLVTLGQIPYGEVVEVEQELISEGLPESEVLKLCDAHSSVLKGKIDLTGLKKTQEGHPIDVFAKENKALQQLISEIQQLLTKIETESDVTFEKQVLKLRSYFNNLFDVDKHYYRKEYLLFPYLERKGITGPPKIMWGKHDEIRELIKGSIEILQTENLLKEDLLTSCSIFILNPAINGVSEMILKEEEILFPMALDKLTEQEWYEISKQSLEFGFCLYDPPIEWKPAWANEITINNIQKKGGEIQLPTGGFSAEEILAILNTLPVDITFVDKNDKVKYFSQSSDRIFQRNRAILNRDVRHCHPPASAHIVEKILEDFKSGKQSRAPFWINISGKLIHIEYFALRNDANEYIGTLEVSHNVSVYKDLEGEQRILSYK